MRETYPDTSKLHHSRLPPGSRVYAIGDVHGRVDLLQEVFSKIERHRRIYPIGSAIEVMLGDYVDRGPASYDVIELLSSRVRNGTICLKGNHESFLLEFLHNPRVLTHWQHVGGLDTLTSYGLEPSLKCSAKVQEKLATEFGRRLPAHHHEFLTSLSLCFELGDYFFVHAGVRPGIDLSRQNPDDLLWIRNEFLSYEGGFGKVVVHGHTPVSEPEIHDNRINLDTGAFATGILTCAVFEDDRIEFL